MPRLYKSILLGVFGIFALAPLYTGAQGVDPVQFLVTPEVVGPNETILIEAQGVGTFLGESTITWTRNGARELSGVGERRFSFTSGKLGERTTVRVSISSASQGTITRDFVFIPSLINLIWEADTYTPTFYKGKAMYSAGSPLKVVAYPTVILNGAQVSINSLSFQWRRNGEAVPEASGLGRNTFSFIGDQLEPNEQIEVDAYIGGTKVAHGEIVIPITAPLLLLYNRDALRGVVYEQAFPQAIALTGKEITIQAEPYFVSNTSKNNGYVSYLWELNGEETSGPDTERGILTLRQEGNGSGNAVLRVSAQNNIADQLIQQGNAFVEIIFGSEAESGSPFSSALGAAVGTFNRIAQNAPTQITVTPQYRPLEPLPSSGGVTYAGDFSNYLATAFRLLVILGALFAVLMLTIGGITYMVSEVPRMKMDGLERARAALFGLLIIAGSWLILNTINPELLSFKLVLQKTTITGAGDMSSINYSAISPTDPTGNNPLGLSKEKQQEILNKAPDSASCTEARDSTTASFSTMFNVVSTYVVYGSDGYKQASSIIRHHLQKCVTAGF